MKRHSDEPEHVSIQTLIDYNQRSADFWRGTREHDVGQNHEAGWSGGRYGVYHDLEAWRAYLSAAGFVQLTHYYRPPGLPREQQPWLASVWRRLN